MKTKEEKIHKELYQCSECKGLILDNGEYYLCINCGLTIDYPLILGYKLKSIMLGDTVERKRKEAGKTIEGI